MECNVRNVIYFLYTLTKYSRKKKEFLHIQPSVTEFDEQKYVFKSTTVKSDCFKEIF